MKLDFKKVINCAALIMHSLQKLKSCKLYNQCVLKKAVSCFHQWPPFKEAVWQTKQTWEKLWVIQEEHSRACGSAHGPEVMSQRAPMALPSWGRPPRCSCCPLNKLKPKVSSRMRLKNVLSA